MALRISRPLAMMYWMPQSPETRKLTAAAPRKNSPASTAHHNHSKTAPLPTPEPPHELIGRGETGAVTRAFAGKKGGAWVLGWAK